MGAPCGWEIERCGCAGSSKCWDGYSPAVREVAAALATGLMWAATGRHYGLCEITVQPCNPRQHGTDYQTWPLLTDGWAGDGWGQYLPVIENGTWYNRCGFGCRCGARCEVPLDGPTTKEQISEVIVDGAVVNPSAYQVHDGYLLVRIDGECWPYCNDYSVQDPIRFQVTYGRGDPIPAHVQYASEILSCQFAKACAGAPCSLPERLTSLTRQGLTVDVFQGEGWEDMYRTGIPQVDAVIAYENPLRRTERPIVMSPDLPTNRMIT